ncbi:MAG: hypothetical protein Q9188_003796 [Gyalolechia gomerana]
MSRPAFSSAHQDRDTICKTQQCINHAGRVIRTQFHRCRQLDWISSGDYGRGTYPFKFAQTIHYLPFRRKRSDENRQSRFRRISSEIPQFTPSPSPSRNPSTGIKGDRHGSSSSIRPSSDHDSQKRSKIDFGPLGLKAIFSPKNSPKVDIVFVHGLGGASQKTWSKHGDPDLFWPLKFLPLEPYLCLSRIFTFGYNANFRAAGKVSTSILDFAKDLLFDLKFAKGDQKEDLNIGKAYILGQNDPQYEAVVKSISAITFLATPHRGTNLAELLNRILRATFFSDSKRYISELGKNSFTLQKLNEQFRHIAPRLDIVSFYETQPTSTGLKSVMILEKDSSILGYPGEISRALDADHHNVCKYDSPHDPNYVAVKNALQSLIAKIVSANESIDDSSSVYDKPVVLKSLLGIAEMPDTDYILFRDQWLQGTLSSKPNLIEKILQLKEHGIDFETATPRTLWERIFKAILFKIDQGLMYWVIDGLDEADDPGAIVKLLFEISGSSIPIRILFVSRETSEIAASFRKVPPELRLNSMSIEGRREDLSYYIQHELSLTDGKLRENVCETVVRESQNNFLWVRLAVETLNLCHSREDIELALHQLPIGMQAFYDRMALSIAQKTDSAQRRLASAILKSVTTTLHVLTVTELSQALHEEAFGILDFPRSIVDVCCGFIVINKDGYVAMVHHTAREYLLEGVDRPFHVERSAAHKQMFLSCMRFLMTVGLRAKVDSKQQPIFLNYAASSWHAHLVATSADDGEVAETLNKFLSGRWVLTWIQILASTDQLRVLIQASRHLSRYLGKQRQNDDYPNQRQIIVKLELARSWVEDFARIVGKFGGILRQNPGSIHKLIPPFCPPDSTIYQQFGKLKDKSLVVSGFSNHNWDDSLARLSYGLGTYATTISAVGAQIATLVPSGTVFLHDSSSFEETVASPINHGGRVYSMVSNTSATLLVTYGYHTIKLWHTRTGNCKLSIDNLQARPRPLTMLFSENDQSLLIGSDDRRIRSLELNPEFPSWQIVADLEEPELEGHFLNSPNHMALDQKGKLVSVAYRGHPLSAWEIDGPVHVGHCWRTRDVLARGEVIEAVWHPHQPEILGLYIEGVIFRWRPYDDETEEFAAGASRLAMSTDGSLIVTGDVRGTVKVFTTAGFTNLYQLVSEDNVLGLAFSPDLRRFYDVRGNYGNVWEPNALLKYVEQHNKDTEGQSEIGSLAQTSNHSESVLRRVDSITSLAASPTGRLYCSGTEKGAVHLYDTQRGKLPDIYESRSFLSIEQTTWSHDGRYVCFSDSSKRVFIQAIDQNVGGSDGFLETTAPISVKTSLDGPITQLLFHLDSTQVMVSSSSSACTVSLASVSITVSAYIGIAGCRWTIHPQDPTLMLCIGPDDIHIFDWKLSLRQAFRMEHSLSQSRLSRPQDQGKVVEILSTADKKQMLVQIERTKENIFLLLEAPSNTTAVSENADRADIGSISTSVFPTELRFSFSPLILHALDLLPSGHLIFLSRDFSICSTRLPIQQDLLPSSFPLDIRMGGESDTQREAANALRSSKASGSTKSRSDDPKPLFWLPRDWISRECIALCKVWRNERSFLCPRNGEVAVVRCAAMV